MAIETGQILFYIRINCTLISAQQAPESWQQEEVCTIYIERLFQEIISEQNNLQNLFCGIFIWIILLLLLGEAPTLRRVV